MAQYAWTIGGLTDVGLKREVNEDCIYFDQQKGLVILADGMGGHVGGEVASAMAVTSIKEDLINSKTQPIGPDVAKGIQRLLDKAINAANTNIFTAASMEPRYRGMGTTVVAAITDKMHLIYGYVGDSRLYRFRAGALEQLSRDHSLLSELVDKGFYTEEEARNATEKNVITRALGNAETVVADYGLSRLEAGDRYLFCSDGLTDLCDGDEIVSLLNEYEDPAACAEALVNAANANGGRDNISVILMRIEESPPGLLKKGLGWLTGNAK